ncbi:MAG TPA: sigma-70 family RNA polymerase sigma factor [Candidatus Didemnitutus sp.]|nr:sigma-70 family RNA polymerase sigma factor [Candidatus Didemnitutus sp.]
MNSSVAERLRAVYVESRQSLYTYAVSITRQREAAEDAIHRAFQQLLRHDTLPADLRPYVFRCVRNAALDDLRRTKVRTDSIFVDTFASDQGTTESGTFSAAELARWLDQLSPDERETIVLKTYEALTLQEIADMRGVPGPTVASWYRRGLAKLKTLMAREIG